MDEQKIFLLKLKVPSFDFEVLGRGQELKELLDMLNEHTVIQVAKWDDKNNPVYQVNYAFNLEIKNNNPTLRMVGSAFNFLPGSVFHLVKTTDGAFYNVIYYPDIRRFDIERENNKTPFGFLNLN